MSKKFIRVQGDMVTLIHYMPFDPVEGLHQTEAELAQTGVLLEDIPEPESIKGKVAQPHYTAEKGFYYTYVDAPPAPATTADIMQLAAQVDYIGMMAEVL